MVEVWYLLGWLSYLNQDMIAAKSYLTEAETVSHVSFDIVVLRWDIYHPQCQNWMPYYYRHCGCNADGGANENLVGGEGGGVTAISQVTTIGQGRL